MQGRSPREIMSGSAGRSKTFRTSGGRAANRKPSSLQSILAARSVRMLRTLTPTLSSRRGNKSSPFSPRVYARTSIFLFVLRERRVAFNDKISI